MFQCALQLLNACFAARKELHPPSNAKWSAVRSSYPSICFFDCIETLSRLSLVIQRSCRERAIEEADGKPSEHDSDGMNRLENSLPDRSCLLLSNIDGPREGVVGTQERNE